MKGRPSIVTNTGPLIALAGVGQLVLLDALFHVIVPEAVASEFAVGKAGLGSDEARRELQSFAEFAGPAIVDPLLAVELDSGEASVIQTARNLGINLVLMDERKGRRLARRVYGLQTIGTRVGGGQTAWPSCRGGPGASTDENRRLLDRR